MRKISIFFLIFAAILVLTPSNLPAQNSKDKTRHGDLIALQTNNLLEYHGISIPGAGHKYLVTYDEYENLFIIEVKWAGTTWREESAKNFVKGVASLLERLKFEHKYKIVTKTKDGATHVYHKGRFE